MTPIAFPDTLATVDRDRLLSIFDAGPLRLRWAIDGLSGPDLDARPYDGKWSIREHVLHVADSELVGAARIRYAVAQPGAPFPMYDQDTWASELEYASSATERLRAALDTFEALRRSSSALLRAVDDDAWTRAGVHGDFGPVTLRQLLELYADHSELHIDRILRTREAIGSPRPFPSLLERRLVPATEGEWP